MHDVTSLYHDFRVRRNSCDLEPLENALRRKPRETGGVCNCSSAYQFLRNWQV